MAFDVGAGLGKSAFRTARAACWCSRCLGLAGDENVSSRKATPTPSVPPTCFKAAGVQGLPFIISATSASRRQMTLPSGPRPETTRSRNACCSAGTGPALSGSAPISAAKGSQHFLGVPLVEQLRGGKVLTLHQLDFQFAQKTRHGHPEIIAHHHHALDPAAVTLPQRLRQLRIGLRFPRMEPLLELVQDDHDLLACRQALAAAQGPEGVLQIEVARQCRTPFTQAVEQALRSDRRWLRHRRQ